ncbi:hypothetical protein QQ020_14335 [Fulvivirgaceae bacterium BMA12]|uniref:Uncharacterized protein n=1 Tax=Agaribacillus aureus TaxID=3051825 RepID=A0ABT8LAE4_9BACT|nr:hypothetical protein [Fulvivirgaceae bacterium BMA12]
MNHFSEEPESEAGRGDEPRAGNKVLEGGKFYEQEGFTYAKASVNEKGWNSLLAF